MRRRRVRRRHGTYPSRDRTGKTDHRHLLRNRSDRDRSVCLGACSQRRRRQTCARRCACSRRVETGFVVSAWRSLYSALLYVLTPFALVRLWWRGRRQAGYRQHIAERFGYYAVEVQKPIVWLHSVSVGETRAAEPLVAALRRRWPDHDILLTHMTPTGRQTGEQVFGASVLRCYLPYDLPGAVSRFLAYFRPQLGLLLETEIWPNLIHACRGRSIPLFLVNARMSQRSAHGYARFAAFTAQTLGELAGIAAQTRADAERLLALGASQVTVCGNLKFDRSPGAEDRERGAQFRT